MSCNTSSLDFMYVEPYPDKDDQPSHYENFAQFVIDRQIPHVAMGLVDIEKYPAIYSVNKDSLLVKHFFMLLPSTIKVSAHPYDGFGNPKWPMHYKGWVGLDAIVHYMADMNELLRSLDSKVVFTGMVVGESMGGYPFSNDKATTDLFRRKLAEVGIEKCTLGASPGGPDIGVDEFYRQMYDWTFYDDRNPNFWLTYKNNPDGFFKALEDPKVHRGWNGDQPPPIPPWSEEKNYLEGDVWKWQHHEPGEGTGLHEMWARSVPDQSGGLTNERLCSWTWDGVFSFYEYVKQQMKTAGTNYNTALYMNDGLAAFH